MNTASGFSLMIHGGAGDFADLGKAQREAYGSAVKKILAQGSDCLTNGGSAVDAVELCVTALEDDPLFNAGRGSVLNEFGMVEMDAGIMEGRRLAAGAVAALRSTKNPVRLARRLLENDEAVFLVGTGAERYAAEQGLAQESEDYFVTPHRLEQLKKARRRGLVSLDHETQGSKGYSTVGAVARDRAGNLAAATSTGGMTNKRWGRVGDTPLVGCGVYAENQRCAISATGVGEHIMRFVLAKHLALQFGDGHEANDQIIAASLEEFRTRLGGEAGVIVIDRLGRTYADHTTQGMVRGWLDQTGAARWRID